jgi:hypothetical protein
MVSVPDVVGLEQEVALILLEESGLTPDVAEELFDPAPKGTVLEQSPTPGADLPRGSSVRLVVSAGTEEFALPDVIGSNVRIAQAQLEQLGLVVRIDTVESEAASDTVVMSNPAPGATVRSSDIVRLTISGQSAATPALLPYGLETVSFVIDPAPVPPGSVDAPAEVARRLQSLLEASGARVMLTRSTTTSDTTEAARAASVTGVWTAVIGIDVRATGEPGLSVLILSTGVSPAVASGSQEMARVLAEQLSQDGTAVEVGTLESDQVLLLSGSPGVRIQLGALSSPEDTAAFRDPAWSDTTARAIYQAVGERFGTQ